GAEYLARSFSLQGKSFLTEDHLVVEVGVYPAPRTPVEVKHSQFRLRLNGKETLSAQSPSAVAAAIKYEDWERRPGLEASAGPVILGRRTPEPRFPGDTRPAQGRLPAPPRAPGAEPQAEP
ncbi:MAG TPA: hypothetical protein DEH78_15500, partial [Solibacterales bacterium]|nr:hypothetical protein [Bryobacterales bacterium]